MKVAIINDIHFGVRGDSTIFLDHLKKFLDEVFYPYLEKNQIKTVVIPGDLVDRRKFINFNTLRRMRKDFLEKLQNDVKVYVSVGNHDVALKNTNELNALTELVEAYNGFQVIVEPTEIMLGDLKCLILPWICQDNYHKCMEIINSTDSLICFGHLELEGFEMHLGSMCHDGLDPKIFSKFHSVFTGHFHHKSSRMNIHYLGAPYQMNWNDYDDPRGFHVFDTETMDLEFIQNPYEMFVKVVYNDKGKTLDDLMGLNFEYLRNSFVKVIVQEKENPYWFDLFIEEIEKRAIDVKIQDIILQNISSETGEEINAQDLDVKSLMNHCVTSGKFKCDKNKLYSTLVDLYTEALTLEI
jgi:DNA repair exonuclease SbcCD nuclease subunit